MSDVKAVLDWFFNAMYNVILTYRNNGGIYFYVTLVVVFFYPLFSRVIKSLKGKQ